MKNNHLCVQESVRSLAHLCIYIHQRACLGLEEPAQNSMCT